MGRIPIALTVAFWLGAVVLGLTGLAGYSYAPGDEGGPPLHWPGGGVVAAFPNTWNLILFVHPSCPCSRASLGEMNRLLARLDGRMAAHVVFLRLAETERSDLWQSAGGIPGVRRIAAGGDAIRRLGAATSGQVLLYDPRGRLRFRGGITPARGHAGDSVGRAAIVALVEGRGSARSSAPVFGCALTRNQEFDAR